MSLHPFNCIICITAEVKHRLKSDCFTLIKKLYLSPNSNIYMLAVRGQKTQVNIYHIFKKGIVLYTYTNIESFDMAMASISGTPFVGTKLNSSTDSLQSFTLRFINTMLSFNSFLSIVLFSFLYVGGIKTLHIMLKYMLRVQRTSCDFPEAD